MIELTEQQLVNDGYRKYTGEKIDVFFNATLCAHAAECVRGNSDVFNTKRKPWIVADAASPEEVASVIERCPSGALQYIRKEES